MLLHLNIVQIPRQSQDMWLSLAQHDSHFMVTEPWHETTRQAPWAVVSGFFSRSITRVIAAAQGRSKA